MKHEPSTLHALEQQRRQAMISADVATLRGLFAQDLVWIHATGRPDTRDALLATIESGKTKYLSIDCSDESLRFYGDTAIVSGIANMKAEIAGEVKPIENRFTIVWALLQGDWKVINWQSTTLRKPT